MTSVRAHDVSFTYPDGDRPAVHEVSLSIDEGTFALAIGATGAGKSTFLRSLNGLVPHFTGGRFSGRTLLRTLGYRRNRQELRSLVPPGAERLAASADARVLIPDGAGAVLRARRHPAATGARWVSLRSTHPTKARESLRFQAGLYGCKALGRMLTGVKPSLYNLSQRHEY